MIFRKDSIFSLRKEIMFQCILNILLFLSYSIDKSSCSVHPYEFFYYLNYGLGAMVINYVLLPKFFYKEKYGYFFLIVMGLVLVLMLIEEEILEKIFFPDTRGAYFGNVVYTLLDIIPVMMILVGAKFAWDASRKQQEVNKLKSLVKESELQFLKTQINPHFLFNNLNNLYSYAIENSKKTPSIILELASVLRYMLYDCKEDFVPLEKEIEHVLNFTKLNQLQIENRGVINLDVESIDAEAYGIAPLILNVFIENAFKHCTASQSNNIEIDIHLHLEKDVLFFTCRNTYGALSNQENIPHGIGLENVKKRLQFLYPDAHELNIENNGQTYVVTLQMKLRKLEAKSND